VNWRKFFDVIGHKHQNRSQNSHPRDLTISPRWFEAVSARTDIFYHTSHQIVLSSYAKSLSSEFAPRNRTFVILSFYRRANACFSSKEITFPKDEIFLSSCISQWRKSAVLGWKTFARCFSKLRMVYRTRAQLRLLRVGLSRLEFQSSRGAVWCDVPYEKRRGRKREREREKEKREGDKVSNVVSACLYFQSKSNYRATVTKIKGTRWCDSDLSWEIWIIMYNTTRKLYSRYS